MKKLITLFFALISTYSVFAQAPQKMSYQAVIRNAQSELVISKPVKMRISILQGSTAGTSVYSELHSATTNANGLVTIEIGGGTSPQGTFSTINWGSGSYFLKTETDPANGTNYSIVGTSQLLSVPYALQANNAGNGYKRVSATGDTLFWDNGKSIIIPGISNANNTATPNTVTDASNNTYPTVTIGTQVWMAENLRTTKYRDGSNIPVVTDNTQWANNFNTGATSPMMCWYNNDQATYTANKFGALYNWYAINPATNGNKNVCPTGWHMPTDAEWTTLTTFLGGESVAGGKMKSTGTQYWRSPNTGATNSSGWSGFPGGGRLNNGSFFTIGSNGLWWSSTELNTNYAWYRYLSYGNGGVSRNYYNKAYGSSVRCLRD
ncbi:MAG: hypothetical protein KGP35_10285 [Bacteroidetes bacterium]|nr:hypothetical protein [Bacteroidota bacterium]